MKLRHRFATVAAGFAAATLLLAGCTTAAEAPATAPATESTAQSNTQEATWPRTITIPGVRGGADTELTIPAEPTQIAALDYESAEVVAELGLASKLVLIPEANLNPALGSHQEALQDVTAFPVAQQLAAENVLAVKPDLVILSPRHGADDTIGKVLTQAGVTVLQLPASWTNQQTLAQGISLIGQATGQEAAAEQLQANIAAKIAAAKAPEQTDKAVVVLTNQAGRPFITAGHAYPLELVELAGAVDAGAQLQLERTGPITAEQLVQLDPAGIVLIDMNGSGDRMFAELLQNPAVASLRSISADKILRVTGKEVQAVGLTNSASGLAKLTAWVQTL